MTQVDPDHFPWGERDPSGGYHVGDYVGLIYSDHEEYVFDNPTGVVVAVEDHEDEVEDGVVDNWQWVTVQVEASIMSNRLYLIERADKENQ